jgi:nuclear transcription Y subunit beta
MKMALPENAKIAKEAKECMQECVSEFISFITSEGVFQMHVSCTRHWRLPTASEKCQQEKRKTVNGEDILFAMTSLGFENYAEALKIYLSRYREVSRKKSPTPLFSPLLPPFGEDVIWTIGIDWWYETLLANQNKPAGQQFAGASGANAGTNANANATAGGQFGENAQHNILSGDTEMADNDNTAFGYAVGNGSADF